MKPNREVFQVKSVKKGAILSLKITLIVGAFFILFFQNFTLKGIAINFLISAMYSFGLGFGNGMLNEFLSAKWDWVAETNHRVTAGIIGPIVYTVPVVLVIDYILFIITLYEILSTI